MCQCRGRDLGTWGYPLLAGAQAVSEMFVFSSNFVPCWLSVYRALCIQVGKLASPHFLSVSKLDRQQWLLLHLGPQSLGHSQTCPGTVPGDLPFSTHKDLGRGPGGTGSGRRRMELFSRPPHPKGFEAAAPACLGVQVWGPLLSELSLRGQFVQGQ